MKTILSDLLTGISANIEKKRLSALFMQFS